MEIRFLISDFLIQLRLLTVKQKEPFLLYRKLLGFYPHNPDWYDQAFRHKSVTIRTDDGLRINNERLEFLGDAVLNVLVSDILFKRFPRMDEDFLTKARANIVQRRSLNKIALDLGLEIFLKSSALSKDCDHQSVYGNALEALIGAIYMDQGYRRCKLFLEKRILEAYIDVDRAAKTEDNYKSALMEWCQHEKKTMSFETTELEKSETLRNRFHANAIVNDEVVGEGTGLSKKEAQQNAAKAGLENILLKSIKK